MISHQLKNPCGFFAPYIPMPKGRGFTARLVIFTILFRKAILIVLIKKLDIPTKTELRENEFFHLHKSILLLAKALKISNEDYKRLYNNAAEDGEKIKSIEELKP